ncbi:MULTISPECIES: DUF883 family protein [Neisseria]|uniref:Bacterial protein of uncharacterized function (DUF883) n=2 Tax=Neisseria TaxID=482 RepID=A0A448DAY5_9NEIS|nr:MULTISPECIES: DUF883 family protein [Neisseria]EGZ44863.1 hypothetical protein HMPREF9370_1940 [Neisseria wadsworthii 9715]OSI12023.1 hypothetical protein BWD07_07340 [Neisseria canis]QMT35585.1 DUF883 domain-containing protein [Neisseria wadsworthii]VEF03229.1 Bacterial protein of uncharacterised function (DUF883) [Neisseria canis]
MRRNYESQKDALLQEIRSVLNDAEALYDQGIERGAEETKALKEKLQSKLERAQSKLSDFEERAYEEARYRVRQVDDYVNDKPYYAMGFAALAGLVTGILLTRR